MVPKRYFRSLVSFVFCCTLFINSDAQNGKIVLINKNKNASWTDSFFSYSTPFSNLTTTVNQMVERHQIEGSQHQIEFQTNQPMLFLFSAKWKLQPVYLFPGDTLKVTKTSNETLPFLFEGTRTSDELMLLSYLEAAKHGFISSSGNYGLEVTKGLNYQYISDQTFERYQERMKFLNEHVASGKISARDKSVISKSLHYRYLSELLFAYERPIQEAFENNRIVPQSYKDKLSQLSSEFNNDSLMYLRDYKRFVSNYARFLMMTTSGLKEENWSSLLAFYKKEFHGKKRDFLLFDEVYGSYQMTGDASIVSQIADSIEDKSLRDTLVSLQKKSKKEFTQRALQMVLEDRWGKKITLQDLLRTFDKKVLYLDLWATWCGPCLFEMPDSEKLAKEYQDDSIEFVYLSIDTDKNKWLKKIPALPNGKNTHHYLITNSNGFTKEMGIPSVPKYIMIGANGQMISFDAPRPKSSEVRAFLSTSLPNQNRK